MRPVPGASSWKTGPLGPEAGPLWWQRWASLSHPHQHASPSGSGTWWLLTWVGGGSSWSGGFGSFVWGREVWLQPLRGQGAGRGPGPVWGCSPSPRGGPTRLLPSGPPLPPGRQSGAGVRKLSRPLSELRREAGLWSVRRTTAVTCRLSAGRAAHGPAVPGLDRLPAHRRRTARWGPRQPPRPHRVSAPRQRGARAPHSAPSPRLLGTCRPDL